MAINFFANLRAFAESAYALHARCGGMNYLTIELCRQKHFQPVDFDQAEHLDFARWGAAIFFSPPTWGKEWLSRESYYVDWFYSSQLEIEVVQAAFQKYCNKADEQGFCTSPPDDEFYKEHSIESLLVGRVVYRRHQELRLNDPALSGAAALAQAIFDLKNDLVKDTADRTRFPACRLRHFTRCRHIDRVINKASLQSAVVCALVIGCASLFFYPLLVKMMGLTLIL